MSSAGRSGGRNPDGCGEGGRTEAAAAPPGAADELKKSERDGSVGSDEARRELDNLQKLTDRWTDEVERVGKHKEQEIMEVG